MPPQKAQQDKQQHICGRSEAQRGTIHTGALSPPRLVTVGDGVLQDGAEVTGWLLGEQDEQERGRRKEQRKRAQGQKVQITVTAWGIMRKNGKGGSRRPGFDPCTRKQIKTRGAPPDPHCHQKGLKGSRWLPLTPAARVSVQGSPEATGTAPLGCP